MATTWITKKSDKKKEIKKDDQVKIEKKSWIKRKPKEYDPTEATAHMKTKTCQK